MVDPTDPLELAYRDLQIRFPVTEIGRDETMILIQIGESDVSVMGVAVNDPGLPSYDVLYPAVVPKRKDNNGLEAAHLNRVHIEGLRWIAGQLLEHGGVRSEFPG